MEELQRFLKDGPTDKEVADAKQAFVEAQKVGRTGDAAIAGQIVSNLNTGRTFAFVADQEKAILALTPAKVADAFRKYVDPQPAGHHPRGGFPEVNRIEVSLAARAGFSRPRALGVYQIRAVSSGNSLTHLANQRCPNDVQG